MITVNQVYEAMQAIAPLELAESWDNPGLLVDCGGAVHRVLTALDITPEVVEEAAAKQCEMIVSHHPVIFDPLKRLGPQDVPFQLVQAGISAVCMHTNLDAAEGGVNEVLAGIFGMKDMETFAEGCGRVGAIEEITAPELARKAQQDISRNFFFLFSDASSATTTSPALPDFVSLSVRNSPLAQRPAFVARLISESTLSLANLFHLLCKFFINFLWNFLLKGTLQSMTLH